MPVAYLAFGQHLDTSSLEEQWERTRATLDWYPGDLEELKKDFFAFRRTVVWPACTIWCG